MEAVGSWGKYKVMEGTLDPFVVQQITTTRNYQVHDKETEPTPQPGEYMPFVSHLERGFKTPSSLFFWLFCTFYKIKPLDLGPTGRRGHPIIRWHHLLVGGDKQFLQAGAVQVGLL
jgi:hypothetical protein